jgi:hypothetical protein
MIFNVKHVTACSADSTRRGIPATVLRLTGAAVLVPPCCVHPRPAGPSESTGATGRPVVVHWLETRRPLGGLRVHCGPVARGHAAMPHLGHLTY